MDFLKKHNVIPKLLAILGAFVFWFIYVYSENPNVDNVWVHDVEVELIGLDKLAERNLVMLDNHKPSASIKLSGTMKEVNEAASNFDDYFEIQIDLSNTITPGKIDKTIKITKLVPSSINALAAGKITFNIDSIIESTVEVQVNLQGSPQSDYFAVLSSTIPTRITVTGPSSYLQHLDKAVATFDISGITSSKAEDLSFIFIDSEGKAVDTSAMKNLTWKPSSINASVKVTHSRDVNLSVGFTFPDYLSHDAIIASITPEMISIGGAPETVEAVHSISLADINLKTFIEDDEQYAAGYVERIIEVPNGVTSSHNGQYAKVFISIPGYMREKFKLEREFFPEIGTLEYIDEFVELTLFGPEENAALITGESLTLTPLFSLGDLIPGEQVLNFAVACENGSVQVLESRVSMLVNVQEIEPEPPVEGETP